MSNHRHGATRRIAAPAADIFKIVSDPAGHVAIDGSGMLDAAPDAQPLTEVGQTFDMAMDRTPIGDIPGLVKYSVRNIVTQLVPDRLVEWTVGIPDGMTVDHLYGWQLEPAGENETDVTNYCDWTNISAEMRANHSWPIVPLAMLESSVAKLERLATGAAKPE